MFVADTSLEIPLGDYIIAIRSRSRFRTLHRRGSCFRLPGRDYLEFAHSGPILPTSDSFHAVCRACFRGGANAIIDNAANTEEDSSASTGSSSE